MINKKIKSNCKINLYLRVKKKLKNKYHKINTLVSFLNIYDEIYISEINGSNDKISFYGNFKNNINKKKNTITKLLFLLRKNNFLENKFFNIKIKKNIPHSSGLGGGSSNAASLLNFFNLKYDFFLSKKKLIKLAKSIGTDVPLSLVYKNTLFTGNFYAIKKFKKSFKLNVLIVFPQIRCSTKLIYSKCKILSKKTTNIKNIKNRKRFINFIKNQRNDLQPVAIKLYPKIQNLLKNISIQKGCYFSRMTGSGSACVGIFSSFKSLNLAKKSIKAKFPNYWINTSKTI